MPRMPYKYDSITRVKRRGRTVKTVIRFKPPGGGRSLPFILKRGMK